MLFRFRTPPRTGAESRPPRTDVHTRRIFVVRTDGAAGFCGKHHHSHHHHHNHHHYHHHQHTPRSLVASSIEGQVACIPTWSRFSSPLSALAALSLAPSFAVLFRPALRSPGARLFANSERLFSPPRFDSDVVAASRKRKNIIIIIIIIVAILAQVACCFALRLPDPLLRLSAPPLVRVECASSRAVRQICRWLSCRDRSHASGARLLSRL